MKFKSIRIGALVAGAMAVNVSGAVTIPAFVSDSDCVCYVNPVSGNDTTARKNSTDLKFKTIQAAIDACEKGGTVRLDDETYKVTAQIELTNGVALVGNGWDKCVITRKSGNIRIVNMDTSSPTLYGVTVCGGLTRATWQSGSGAGIFMNSGTVSWCCVSNNWAAQWENNTFGGGISVMAGTIDHSLVAFNKSSHANAGGSGAGGGIGSYWNASGKITIDTCLVYGNVANQRTGGGIYAGAANMTIRNTTVAQNTAGTTGGGIYLNNASVAVVNCILSDNTAPNDTGAGAPNWASGSDKIASGVAALSANTLFGNDSASFGTASATGSAQFKSLSTYDFHLQANSDAKELGAWYEGIVNDLENNARTDPPAAGCYIYDSSAEPFSCLVDTFAATAFTNDLVTFSATTVNPPSGATLVFTWYLTNQFEHVETFTGNPAQTTLPPGTYSVAVRATAGSVESKLGVSEQTIKVAVRTNYVTCVENPNAVFPYDTPKTATTSVHEALASAISGTTIILDEGTHFVSSQILLDKGVTLVGQGRDRSTIARSSGKFQMLYLNHADALAKDLTLCGAQYDERWGAGGAVVIGACGGTVTDCRIQAAQANGTESIGAAIYMGAANALCDRCLVECCTNKATSSSGGSWRAGIVYVASGTLRNTLVKECVSTDVAGIAAAAGGEIDNCTFVSNVMNGVDSYASAMGLVGGKVRNCIFWGNLSPNDVTPDSATHGKPNWTVNNASSKDDNVSKAQNCCWAGSTPAGSGSAGTNVLFRNAAAGDYHLQGYSSCRNKGLVLDWMMGACDLEGNSRLYGKAPDIGCYELQYDAGFILLVR